MNFYLLYRNLYFFQRYLQNNSKILDRIFHVLLWEVVFVWNITTILSQGRRRELKVNVDVKCWDSFLTRTRPNLLSLERTLALNVPPWRRTDFSLLFKTLIFTLLYTIILLIFSSPFVISSLLLKLTFYLLFPSKFFTVDICFFTLLSLIKQLNIQLIFPIKFACIAYS